MSEENQDWIVPGAKIIEYRHYAGEQVVGLRTIESVAPKSFVVGGTRVRKERMKRQVGGDYGPTYHYVNPSSEEAGPLLRLREVQRAQRRIEQAMQQWRLLGLGETDARVYLAKHLADLLLDYVKVQKGE